MIGRFKHDVDRNGLPVRPASAGRAKTMTSLLIIPTVLALAFISFNQRKSPLGWL